MLFSQGPPDESTVNWMSVPGPCKGLSKSLQVGVPARAFVVYWYFTVNPPSFVGAVKLTLMPSGNVVAEALARLGDPEISVEEALRWLFEELVRVHQDDPVLTRVLSTQVPHQKVDEANRGDTDELVLRLQEILVRRSEIRVRDWMAAAHVVATATEALTRWLAHEAPNELATEALIEEIVAMLAGYLTKQ